MPMTARFKPNPRLRKRIRKAQNAGALAFVEAILQSARRAVPRLSGALAGSATVPRIIRTGRARAAFTAKHALATEARSGWLNRAIRRGRRKHKRAAAKAFRRALRRG